jgi:hypothetical protein
MKRFLVVLVCALTLNGCDDGNLTLENIDLESAVTKSCSDNNVIYKLNKQEALLLEIPNTLFANEPTEIGNPTLIDINNTSIRVVYRFYNGLVTSDNICNTIPPPTPIVTNQWTTNSGKIQITTTAIKTINALDNSTRISGYNHNIAFKNITFIKSNGTQVYENFPFGDYVTAATTLPFGFDKALEQCTDSKQIYNYTSSEALTLDIDPALIINTVTPLNTPRTGLISTNTNKLTYRLYSNGVLTPSYFCTIPVPSIPTVSEEWNGMAGVSAVSGIVEVTTTTNGPNSFKHTIVLKKATLQKGNSNFSLGDNYLYGDLLTN